MITAQEYLELAEAQRLLNWARERNEDEVTASLLSGAYSNISNITHDYRMARLEDDENTG